nr:hypothetical protein [Tanacetum cinerariifolium]
TRLRTPNCDFLRPEGIFLIFDFKFISFIEEGIPLIQLYFRAKSETSMPDCHVSGVMVNSVITRITVYQDCHVSGNKTTFFNSCLICVSGYDEMLT